MPKKGYKPTEEHKHKLSIAHLGKKLTEEHKKNVSLALKGKKKPPFTEEHRKNLSISLTGNSRHKGHKLTEETKRKLRIAHLGRKYRPMSEIGRRNISESKKGEKNNFWQGGKTELSFQIKHSLEYRLWREAVFKRDNFICQDCNLKGGWNTELKKRIVLQVHHIKPKSLFPKLIFVIDNGQTLCRDCHKQTDTYGKNILTKPPIILEQMTPTDSCA